jgi:hypothetical protein
MPAGFPGSSPDHATGPEFAINAGVEAGGPFFQTVLAISSKIHFLARNIRVPIRMKVAGGHGDGVLLGASIVIIP